MRKLIKYNPGAIAWSAFILLLLLVPTKGIDSPSYPYIDKVIHAGLFSVLCYLCITGRVKRHRFSGKRMNVARNCLFFCIGFGVATELLQLALGYRSFDLWDIVADAAGAFTGYAYFQFWISKCLQPDYTYGSN